MTIYTSGGTAGNWTVTRPCLEWYLLACSSLPRNTIWLETTTITATCFPEEFRWHQHCWLYAELVSTQPTRSFVGNKTVKRYTPTWCSSRSLVSLLCAIFLEYCERDSALCSLGSAKYRWNSSFVNVTFGWLLTATVSLYCCQDFQRWILFWLHLFLFAFLMRFIVWLWFWSLTLFPMIGNWRSETFSSFWLSWDQSDGMMECFKAFSNHILYIF